MSKWTDDELDAIRDNSKPHRYCFEHDQPLDWCHHPVTAYVFHAHPRGEPCITDCGPLRAADGGAG